ncbi:pogo transposable element with KRAB domain-like [Brachionus plicatilis]|uniref:Pogo transposable element with KRAB domain-like n=1 Tax=Brachionus plicatilis TaxID=10195 RepID=A0A3M7R121_BRAPC|nr:pogo transposable element with KRAB domain-like [Brachionus plicatilis]
MDETSIYLDFPSNYTYDTKGARRVKANTTGGERVKLSAAFTASASGEKLPIYIVVPRKTDLPNFKVPDNVVVHYKSGATFDTDLLCEYITKILIPYKLINTIDEIEFIVDSAPCHRTEKVRDLCDDNEINQVFIPPRFTNLLQPADVCWFATLKRAYHKKWNDWFLNDEKTYTKNGNARSPGYVKCIEWLSDIWLSLDSNLIARSFDSCGITSQFNLHTALDHMMKTNSLMNDFVDDLNEADDIDGFEDDQDCVASDLAGTVSSSPEPEIQPSEPSPSIISVQQTTPSSTPLSCSANSASTNSPLFNVSQPSSSINLAQSSPLFNDENNNPVQNGTNCSNITISNQNEEVMRRPLQSLNLNRVDITPVVVLNKDGSVRKPLGRKKGSKNKSSK